jgi:hypothetical protein
VGWDLRPLAALGYERRIETGLALRDKRQTYLDAIHVPDGVTLNGSNQTLSCWHSG